MNAPRPNGYRSAPPVRFNQVEPLQAVIQGWARPDSTALLEPTHFKYKVADPDLPFLTPLHFYAYHLFGASNMPRNDLQGSLDLLVLKTLSQTRSLHGYGIVLHIQQASDRLLQVEEGSIYPALHRIENHGWVTSEWGPTETNRKAKYYKLTPAGRKELLEAERSFEQLVKGIRAVLRYV